MLSILSDRAYNQNKTFHKQLTYILLKNSDLTQAK